MCNILQYLYSIGDVSKKWTSFNVKLLQNDDFGLMSMTSKCRRLTSKDGKVSDASSFSKLDNDEFFDVFLRLLAFLTISI